MSDDLNRALQGAQDAYDKLPAWQQTAQASPKIEGFTASTDYRITALERDNEALRQRLTDMEAKRNALFEEVTAAKRELAALREQHDEAVSLLAAHGRHPESCPLGTGIGLYTAPPDAECSCGIRAAIDALRPAIAAGCTGYTYRPSRHGAPCEACGRPRREHYIEQDGARREP